MHVDIWYCMKETNCNIIRIIIIIGMLHFQDGHENKRLIIVEIKRKTKETETNKNKIINSTEKYFIKFSTHSTY